MGKMNDTASFFSEVRCVKLNGDRPTWSTANRYSPSLQISAMYKACINSQVLSLEGALNNYVKSAIMNSLSHQCGDK